MGHCHKQELSRSAVGVVERCSCGLVHVTVGPVTLRLEPQVLGEVAAMLANAVDPQPEALAWPQSQGRRPA